MVVKYTNPIDRYNTRKTYDRAIEETVLAAKISCHYDDVLKCYVRGKTLYYFECTIKDETEKHKLTCNYVGNETTGFTLHNYSVECLSYDWDRFEYQ